VEEPVREVETEKFVPDAPASAGQRGGADDSSLLFNIADPDEGRSTSAAQEKGKQINIDALNI
jgi:hypothetical protein